MKCINYWFQPAFMSCQTQVWAGMDTGVSYRVFGDGDSRRVHRVTGTYFQPLVRGKKARAEILAAVDEAESVRIKNENQVAC